MDANGSDIYHWNSINVEMWAIQGECDNWLKWPAQVDFTIEIINQCSRPNIKSRSLCTWDKPTNYKLVSTLNGDTSSIGVKSRYIMKHSDIHSYSTEDSLHFNISQVQVLSL